MKLEQKVDAATQNMSERRRGRYLRVLYVAAFPWIIVLMLVVDALTVAAMRLVR